MDTHEAMPQIEPPALADDPDLQRISDEFYATHGATPSSHETADHLENATIRLGRQVAAHHERRFDSDESLSDEAYEVVERLRIEREKQGRELARYHQQDRLDGTVLRPFYGMPHDAYALLANPAITSDDAIAILRELDMINKHREGIGLSMTAEEREWSENYLNSSSRETLVSLDGHKIRELLELKGQDGQFFRRMHTAALQSVYRTREALKNADDPLWANHKYSNSAELAKLEGFASLKEKYEAIQAGTAPPDDELMKLNPVDIFLSDQAELLDFNTSSLLSIEYLSQHLGLPPALSTELLLSFQNNLTIDRHQFHHSQLDSVEKSDLVRELSKISERISHFGVETIERLRVECGLINISELSIEQLTRMVQFIDDDPALIERLHTEEVCVILRDATADWNGAFGGTYANFEPTDGIMLAFEISSMRESGRQIQEITQKLIDRGIEPSVLVVAGHGEPGAIQFGDGLLVMYSSLKPDNISTAATIDESGILNLIATMRPDRDGNSHIIYKSCSAGSSLGDYDQIPVKLDNPALKPLKTTERIPNTHRALGIRPSVENSLVLTGRAARHLRPDMTYHVVGMDTPGNVGINDEGALGDSFNQAITEIFAPAGSQAAYRRYSTDVTIPMFVKPKSEKEETRQS